MKISVLIPQSTILWLTCFMVADASGMVKLWHFTTGACLHTTNEARQSLCSTVSGQRDKYATAGSDPRIHIYDVHTKTKLTSLEPR